MFRNEEASDEAIIPSEGPQREQFEKVIKELETGMSLAYGDRRETGGIYHLTEKTRHSIMLKLSKYHPH